MNKKQSLGFYKSPLRFCGEVAGWEERFKGVFKKPSNVNPIKGYEVPTNKETGEQLPNCCGFHKQIFKEAETTFEKFPNCCELHKLLIGKRWFKKENYNGIANKIVTQLSYTQHHIFQQITSNNWYQEITGYIEHNASSFGNPAIGLHLYLVSLKHIIKKEKNLFSQEQKQELIKFIEDYYSRKEDVQIATFLYKDYLYETYQKWLELFPFEISFFGGLKQYFEEKLQTRNAINIYSRTDKKTLLTKASVIEALTNLTDELLKQINPYILYEKGLLTEPQKIELELVLSQMRIDNERGYTSQKQNEEQPYMEILEKWFNRQKKFINDVAPLLKALPPQQNETKTGQKTPKTFEELFYNPEHAEPCLKILSELQPPVIDAINNYIGKAKGVFPLWVKVLKNHKPKPLIKNYKDTVYKDLLNNKVIGLNLTKDASEFRKHYVRLENNKIELDIKAILSQYSQSGKLGK